MCVHMNASAHIGQRCEIPQELGFLSSCKLPNVGAGNLSQVLRKSSMCS